MAEDLASFAARIDHTVLGPATEPSDVRALLSEATEYGTNACVPPCYVTTAAETAPDVPLATVIGFPHGHHEPATKAHEARLAAEAGADELDTVIPVGKLTAGDDEAVADDVATVVEATDCPVKVIVEAALLSEAEKHRVGEIVRDAGAEMLKTSTGFADGGATIEDVELLSQYLPVKASGGIGSYEKARAMIDAGAERIGASSGVEIIRSHPDFED